MIPRHQSHVLIILSLSVYHTSMAEKQDIEEVGNDKSVSQPVYTHAERPVVNMADASAVLLTPEDVCDGSMSFIMCLSETPVAYFAVRMLAFEKRLTGPSWPS